MKKIIVPILLGLTLTLTGCIVTSVYPFYSESDVIFDPALIERWADAEAKDHSGSIYEFKKNGEREYRLTIFEAGASTSSYEARLFKIKEQLFLDLLPTERHGDFVPTHQLWKVIRLQPTLQVADLKLEWLVGLLEKEPNAIRHVKIKETTEDNKIVYRVVLTASTQELQQFVLKHLKTEEAWRKPTELKRKLASN